MAVGTVLARSARHARPAESCPLAMIRNMPGTILCIAVHESALQYTRTQSGEVNDADPIDRNGGVRSRVRARYVPGAASGRATVLLPDPGAPRTLMITTSVSLGLA
jgi:hypothetical protein